jgi:A nuclease family of the HNH/ENDO VII superfamily with conserved AHH
VTPASKPPSIWRAWLLLAFACWACVLAPAAHAFAPQSVSGVAPVGPKNRVWDFLADHAETRPESSPQVAKPHQEKPACGYEPAPGLTVYAHANPVSFSDPSGHMSLVEVGVAVVVTGVLYSIAQPRIESVIGSGFAALGFVPNAAISISSIGLYGESDLLLQDFGLSASDFSGNLLVQAATRISSDAIAGHFASLGGKYALGAFAKARAARTVNQSLDFSSELQESRSRLAERLGGHGGQAHHVITWEMRTHPFVRKAARGGFRMNGPGNGVRLPPDVHFGSHPDYNTNVHMTLDLLHEAFPKASPAEAAAMADQYIRTLRSDIANLVLNSTKLR